MTELSDEPFISAEGDGNGAGLEPELFHPAYGGTRQSCDARDSRQRSARGRTP